MHRSPTALPALLLVAALLAGCGDDDGPAAVETTTTTGAGQSEPAAAGGPVTTAPAATDEDEEAAEAVRVVELVYEGGEVTTGGGRVDVAAGEDVRLEILSDVDDEVHVHGYDIEVGVVAGTVTTVELVGDLPGVWEVELHDSGALLTQLAVAG